MKILLVFLCFSFTLAQECVDKNSFCSTYARFGFCKAEKRNMIKNCPKSCGFCGLIKKTTLSPVTKIIVTESPITDNPITDEPVTDSPITDSTITDAPITDNPITDSPSEAQCGRVMVQTGRIVNGQQSVKGSWPWQVSIYYNRNFLCGGSIISPQWILTAAHCVDGFDYTQYQIVLGDYNRQDVDGDEQVYYAVTAFHHPDWMYPSKLNNDVALIQLNRLARFTAEVQPVCLPGPNDIPPVGKTCYITGWGQSIIAQRGPPTVILKQSPLKIVDQRQCFYLNTRNLGIRVTNKMLCAGYGPYSGYPNSGCHGDSGGPFVCQEDNGRWVLQGSVSWGSGYCDASEAYSVFARITQFRGWIDQYINS